MAGTPGEVYKCSAGQLYDGAQQRCNWEDEVVCTSAVDELYDEDGNPLPTKQPSPPPTPPPNPLLEWNPNAVDRGHDKTIIGYVSLRCVFTFFFDVAQLTNICSIHFSVRKLAVVGSDRRTRFMCPVRYINSHRRV